MKSYPFRCPVPRKREMALCAMYHDPSQTLTEALLDLERRRFHAAHHSTGEKTMDVPEGFAVVSPYIFADDADAYVRFLEVAFGAREIGRSMDPDGRIANCQVSFGTATMMISEASERFPASSSAFYLYVPEVYAAMAAAEEAGAIRIMDIADMPYGDRQGGVRDPSGNIWWVSQRLSAKGYF